MDATKSPVPEVGTVFLVQRVAITRPVEVGNTNNQHTHTMSNTTHTAPDALIVRLTIHQFCNRVKDRTITDEVQMAKALGLDAGAWMKNKLPPDATKAIGQQANVIRSAHNSMTLPWSDGQRLLNAASHDRYTATMEPLITQFDERVNALGLEYGGHVEAARRMHGSTFVESDYPAWESVRSCYGIETEYLPMPSGAHFLARLAEPTIARMRSQLEAANARRFEDAVRDAWTRLLAPVRAMADKLGSGDAIFRDSLVDNIRDITAMMPTLNLTNDASMREAAQQIHERLANLDPAKLRENKVERREVAQAAAAIVARFGALGARRMVE